MIRPRPHQFAAIKDILRAFIKSDRAQVHMACGSGKTFIAYKTQEALDSGLTVMFVPTILLAHQACKDFIAYGDNKPNIVVCSADLSQEDRDDLEEISLTYHVTVCLDQGQIFAALREHPRANIFCTYLSAEKLVRAMGEAKLSADITIFDECHHVTSSTNSTGKWLSEHLPTKRLLSQTATPKLNPEINLGEVAHTLSFKKAVELGILCPYKIQISVYRTETFHPSASIQAAVRATQFAVNQGLKRGLTFHNSVQRAKFFRDQLRKELRDVEVFHLSAKDRASVRNDVIRRVKSEGGVITNVRVLGEGFNFPELEFIVVVDPRSSVVEITQNVGRIMRRAKGKAHGVVSIPVLVTVDGVHEVSKETFRNAILALAAHDSILAQHVQQLTKGDKTGSGEFEKRLDFLGDVGGVDLTELKHTLINCFERFEHYDKDEVVDEIKQFVAERGYYPTESKSADEHEQQLSYRACVKRSLEMQQGLWNADDSELFRLKKQYPLISYTSLAGEHNLIKFVGKYWSDRPELRKTRREDVLESLGVKPIYIGYQQQLMLTAKGAETLLANKSLFQDTRYEKAG